MATALASVISVFALVVSVPAVSVQKGSGPGLMRHEEGLSSTSLGEIAEGARQVEFSAANHDELTEKVDKMLDAVKKHGWEDDMYTIKLFNTDGVEMDEEYAQEYPGEHHLFPMRVVFELSEGQVGLLQMTSAQIKEYQDKQAEVAEHNRMVDFMYIHEGEATNEEKEMFELQKKNAAIHEARMAEIHKDEASLAAYEATLTDEQKDLRASFVEMDRILKETKKMMKEQAAAQKEDPAADAGSSEAKAEEAAAEDAEDDGSSEAAAEDDGASEAGSDEATSADDISEADKNPEVGKPYFNEEIGDVTDPEISITETLASQAFAEALADPPPTPEMVADGETQNNDTDPDAEFTGYQAKDAPKVDGGNFTGLLETNNKLGSMVGRTFRSVREAEPIKDIWKHRNEQLALLDIREAESRKDGAPESRLEVVRTVKLIALEDVWVRRIKSGLSVDPKDWPQGRPWIEFLEKKERERLAAHNNGTHNVPTLAGCPADGRLYAVGSGYAKGLIGSAKVCSRFKDEKNHISHCSDERLHGWRHQNYRGCQTFTKTNKECQKWNAQKPHRHTGGDGEQYGYGAGRYMHHMMGMNGRYGYYHRVTYRHGTGKHNYCRNPNGMSGGIWCYTINPNKRWEYCSPLNPAIVGQDNMQGMPSPRWRGHSDTQTDCDFLGMLECAGYCTTMITDDQCGNEKKPFNWKCEAPAAHGHCIKKIFSIIVAFFDMIVSIIGMAVSWGATASLTAAANAAKKALTTSRAAAKLALKSADKAEKGFRRFAQKAAKMMKCRITNAALNQYYNHLGTGRAFDGSRMQAWSPMDVVNTVIGVMDFTGIYATIMAFAAEPCISHVEASDIFNGGVNPHNLNHLLTKEVTAFDWALFHYNYGNRKWGCWSSYRHGRRRYRRDGYSYGCRVEYKYRGVFRRIRFPFGQPNIKGRTGPLRDYHENNKIPAGFEGVGDYSAHTLRMMRYGHMGMGGYGRYGGGYGGYFQPPPPQVVKHTLMGGACCRAHWGRTRECRGKGPMWYHACS